jgi:saccharopine dehydrogenase-like NADP-dependent oxidoreductase
MFTISLFGAGKIGVSIATLLSNSGRYSVRICDIDESRAKEIAEKLPNCSGHKLNVDDSSLSLKLLEGSQAVISALPFYANPAVAECAHKAQVHYLDLTEDVEVTKKVSSLAMTAKSAFLPQCGLAPGFISIAAAYLSSKFEKVDEIKMRVGALPIYPSNAFKYNLTWSTEGLVNEYAKPCEAIDDWEKQIVRPLDDLETFSLDGAEYEAFNTSGGLGTLCDTMLGKVRKLNYKSIRYPGHRDIVKFLMQDLRFKEKQSDLVKILEEAIPSTKQDKCIIFVEVSGEESGKFTQRTYASTVYNQVLHGVHFGALQLTTSSGICTPLDLLLTGKLNKQEGLIKLEEIPLTLFLENEFGIHYRDEKALSGIE